MPDGVCAGGQQEACEVRGEDAKIIGSFMEVISMNIKLKYHGALAEYHCFIVKALDEFDGKGILGKIRLKHVIKMMDHDVRMMDYWANKH